nr:hypothetical protein [Tanacetum cinerariifolium]
MFLNVEQLENQLDKEDFQEIRSMAAFNVLETQFQMFITNRDYLNDEYIAMTHDYFIQYTRQTILEFHDTLIQHLEVVKKSIDERVQLKRSMTAGRTESKGQDTSSRSGNDAHADDADIRPIYDEGPMAEVQTTAEIDVFVIGQQHTEQPEFNNEGEVVQNAEECHDTWKSMSQPLRNQSVVRQPTALKSERPRISKPRCDSQVDVHNDLSKPVTTDYLPKEREAASAKPHHMVASSNSRISSKNMTRFSSNDMVHNHYQEEAKKRTQEHSRNSKPSLMTSARSQSTANGSKPMPKRTQTSRNWPASKNIFVTTKTVPIAEHPRNSRNDFCVTKFLKEANSRAKVPSNKTTNRNKPVKQTVGLRWVPTGRILTSCTTKVYSEPLNGSNAYITNQYECEQTLDVSVGTLNLSADADVPSQQELDMLFGPLYDEFFNAGTNPSTTIPSTSTHTNMHAEENNNDQAEEGEHVPDAEFANPFCTPIKEVAESSSHNIRNSNVSTFNQPQVSEYQWTKDHPLEQVRGYPSRPVQTR